VIALSVWKELDDDKLWETLTEVAEEFCRRHPHPVGPHTKLSVDMSTGEVEVEG
jgi:hypothetical protein